MPPPPALTHHYHSTQHQPHTAAALRHNPCILPEWHSATPSIHETPVDSPSPRNPEVPA